ncbi:MAG: TolB family protein [Syntrophomonadaceae bacterium]
MKKISYSFFILIFLSSLLSAQKLSVVETVKITDKSQGEFYFPKLSPDGSRVFFTSAGYKGLWYYDMQAKKIVPFTEEQGAGYEFAFSNDGKSVYYRVNNFDNHGLRTSQTMIQKNIQTKKRQVLETAHELSAPRILMSNKLTYTSNNKFVMKAAGTAPKKSTVQNNVTNAVVYIEDQALALYSNGTKKKMTPLGAGNYIWPSVSPDGTKILFTLAGKGTFISGIDGNILLSLGYANAPKWSPDGKWVIYMVDGDNGLEVTSSDIYAVSADGQKRIQLTSTDNDAEMYPEWSSDAQSILYHTDEGSIYLMKLSND